MMERNLNLGYSKLKHIISIKYKSINNEGSFNQLRWNANNFVRRRQDNKYLLSIKKQKNEMKESKSRKQRNSATNNSSSKIKEIIKS
ncbi:unnamed protein product [Paramecium octaurelia]|uniref:Uncharacterized protein n=1 Tax=Paramecium octaurelia TaxID=43137 RepID=A0A8S1XBI4_PAROT|nr:unnamed protein product [Paramecium octaurelia]